MKNLAKNFLLLLAALLVGFGICEIAARLLTTVDENGQAYYGKRPLLPYHFPGEMVRQKMDHYFSRRSEAYIVDDPLLGWTIGPDRSNVEGMYRSNSAGIRSRPAEYDPRPPQGVLRVAIFGDSFTHGDEEPYDKTWGKLLEDALNEAGISAEVLNFGVPGYGVGQAYLRWKHQGRDYSPRIAVFGFQPENIKRTVNVFRSLYSRDTWLVFSKPRFFIDRVGELDLVNCPVVPPEEVADTIENLARSPLAEHEYWYSPDNYRETFWLKSRFISLLYTVLNEYRPKPGGRHDHRPGLHCWDPDAEPMRTSLLVLKKFVRDVREAGEVPIILHLPKKNDLECLEGGATPAHYELLRELEREGALVVDPAPAMMGGSGLYKHSHLSSRGGEIVAGVLAEAIVGLLEADGLRDGFRGEVPSRQPPDFRKLLLERSEGEDGILIDLGTVGDRPFIEGGFHQREKHLGRTTVRWTAQTALLRLPIFPGRGDRPVVRFRILDTGPERGETGRASVEFRGRTLGGVELGAGERTYAVELSGIDPATEEGLAQLIVAAIPWRPAEALGVKDTRELGVMMDWVELEYR